MVGPEKPRPAQELVALPRTIPEEYLQFLKEREGRLCTVEELKKHRQNLIGVRVKEPRSLSGIFLEMRQRYLGERETIVTLLTHAQRAHGFYYLSDGREEVGSLSELGISLFEDGLEGGLVIPGLSVLSRKINQNPLIKPVNLLPLFDKLSPKDCQNRQRPYLTLSERRLMVLLAEHPEGVEAETILKHAFGVDFPDLAREKYILDNHLVDLRHKIEGVFRIHRLPFPSKPGEKRKFGEARYFLLGEEKVGEEIQIPPEEKEIFSSLPGPVGKMVEELCGRFIVGEQLNHSLSTFGRRLLYFLSSKFGYPCSIQELFEAVNPSGEPYYCPSRGLSAVKREIQKKLEGTEFGIITIPRCYEVQGFSFPVGAYVLGYRVLFQEEKMEIPIRPWEFDSVNARIRERVRKICQLTIATRNKRGELIHRRTAICQEERKILLALARNFPEGCSFQLLASSLNYKGNCLHGYVNDYVSGLRKKIRKEFPDLGISIRYDRRKGQYRLEVQK